VQCKNIYHHIIRVSTPARVSSDRTTRWRVVPRGSPRGSTKSRPASQASIWSGRKNQPTARCWWCLYRTQTRDHLFKNCPRWKPQQKTLWVEVRKRKRSVQGPWPLGRYEVQPAGVGLPLHHGCRGGARWKHQKILWIEVRKESVHARTEDSC
jgi:hypothetical protein